jgi:DNA-binding transcriptional regulator YiaG
MSHPAPAEIVALRTSYNITQAQAAEAWFCSLGGVRKWESGERQVHPLMWWAMRKILQLNAKKEQK